MGDEGVRGEVGEAGDRPLRTKTVTREPEEDFERGAHWDTGCWSLWSRTQDNQEAGWSVTSWGPRGGKGEDSEEETKESRDTSWIPLL